MPPLNVALRPLGMADVPSVLAIEQQSHALPWGKALFIGSFNAQHWMQGVFSCNDANHELLAYVVFAQGLDDWELLNVTTIPSHRGQGLAKQLITAGANAAVAACAQRVLLEVRPSNAAALAAYDSLGFQQIAVRKNYYAASPSSTREDALILALNLEQYQVKQKN